VSRRANIVRHGANHKGRNSSGSGGGSDPAVLNVDSTDNVGADQGVHSISTGGNHPPGYILTATGAGGSIWGPAIPATSRTIAQIALENPCIASFWAMDDVGPGAVDIGPAGADLIENPTGTSTGLPVGYQGAYSFTYEQAGPYAGITTDKSIQFDGDASGFSSHGTCLYHEFTGANATSGSYTIAGWAFLDDSGLATFFTFWPAGTPQTSMASGGGDITFGAQTSATFAVVTAAGAATTSTWLYLTGTYDATTKTFELFINGVSQGTATLSAGTNDASAGYLRFGCAGNSIVTTPTNFLRGRLSSWAMFNCVLTPTEINELYGASGGAVGSGFVPTADGSGGWVWAPPTIAVDAPAGRYDTLNLGANITGTDEGDGSITLDVTGAPPSGAAGGDLGGSYPNPDVATVDSAVLGSGTPDATSFLRGDRTWQTIAVDPADDTAVWMPLTTTVAGDDVLVFDADHSLIPTLIPL
jgi:hypothetical protein